MKLDLDAKRAGRAEATNQGHEVQVGSDTFTFPARVPLLAIDLMAEGSFRAAFAVLFDEYDEEESPVGGEVTARFFKHRPDDADLEDIMGLYGQLGESSGSRTSLGSNGSRSKPISKRSTTSTSRKPATALNSSAPDGSSPS